VQIHSFLHTYISMSGFFFPISFSFLLGAAGAVRSRNMEWKDLLNLGNTKGTMARRHGKARDIGSAFFISKRHQPCVCRTKDGNRAGVKSIRGWNRIFLCVRERERE